MKYFYAFYTLCVALISTVFMGLVAHWFFLIAKNECGDLVVTVLLI